MEPIFKIFKRARGENDPFNGIGMGDEAADTITGFGGVVVATVQNISGCDQICLQPVSENNKFEEPRWFDIERVSLVKAGKVEFTDRRTGADTSPPTRTPTY